MIKNFDDNIQNFIPEMWRDAILDYAERKHDATLGITYDTLEWHCDYLFPVKEKANEN